MGRTDTVLRIVKAERGTFNIFLDDRLDRQNIDGAWLEEEICTRFGYCGEEYALIALELDKHGQASRTY